MLSLTKIQFIIGDVRDKERLYRAFDSVDYVVLCMTTKIVSTSEYNPFECIKTNIDGAMNVIDCSLDRGVKIVIALSTDKACAPINLYGATKLASDKLFVSANSYSGNEGTKFAVVRYGNVMGSRGSVIPFFESIKNQGVLPVTHEDMTRFMIDLTDAVDLVWHSFINSIGGEIYVRKIPSMKIIDIAKVIAPNATYDIIGIRPGEKLHEMMISKDDSLFTYDYGKYYKILPNLFDWKNDPKRIQNGKKVENDFQYSSDNNKNWMTNKQLKDWILNNFNMIEKT